MRRLFILCLLISVLPWTNTVASEHRPPIDKTELLSLLRSKKFEELASKLHEHQLRFENAEESDYRVAAAYAAFANSDPQITKLLDEWVEDSTGRYEGLLARATHWHHLGRHIRGIRSTAETAPQAFEKMRQFLKRAINDAQDALNINNELTPAYQIFLRIATLSGPTARKREILDKALKHAPRSLIIRGSYVESLRPWWGGSMEEIRAFVEETKQSAPKGLELDFVYTYPDYVAAMALERKGRFLEAMEQFGRLAEATGYPGHRYSRAEMMYYRNIGDLGLSDINKAIEKVPQYTPYLDLKARILIKLNEPEKALKYWERALTHDPLNPFTLHRRAYWYKSNGYRKESLEDFNNALVYGEYNDITVFWRGQLHYALGDIESSKADIKRAWELAPWDPERWLSYAHSLTLDTQRVAGCDAIEVFKAYLKICESQKSCSRMSIANARSYVDDKTGFRNQCHPDGKAG